MPITMINGIRLNYEIRGEGPRLLFIHGIGADLKNPISIFNSPLAHRFTILAFDPRGLGESDSPEEPCSIADLADDAAALAAAVGWDHYHVLGASMGGMVAQELALRHPESVDKLILGVTNAGGTTAPILIDKLDDMTTTEKLKLSDTRQDDAWIAAHPEMVSRAEAQFKIMRETLEANPSLLRGYNHQVNAVLQHDTYGRLPQVTAPTFIFAGRYDGSNPLHSVKAMADQIPGSHLELIDFGHGNWFFDTNIWEIITNFLHTKK